MSEDNKVNVKKAYVDVVNFLTENSDKKVKSVLDDVIAMCMAKGAGGVATASHSVDGVLVAVRCSFFGLWFPVSHVPFGNKAGSATGLNSMCKEGANLFSFGQRTYRNAKEALLMDVEKGDVKPEQITAELEKLEKARKTIPPFSIEGMGWTELDDCLAVTEEELDVLVEASLPEEEDEVNTETED